MSGAGPLGPDGFTRLAGDAEPKCPACGGSMRFCECMDDPFAPAAGRECRTCGCGTDGDGDCPCGCIDPGAPAQAQPLGPDGFTRLASDADYRAAFYRVLERCEELKTSVAEHQRNALEMARKADLATARAEAAEAEVERLLDDRECGRCSECQRGQTCTGIER